MVSYVIAGASRGIGLEFVKQLLARDYTVIALARNPEGSKGLLEINNENLHILKADITDPAALKAAAEATAKITGGSLDVLINNAAVTSGPHMFHAIDEYSDPNELISDFNHNWATNVVGPILTINAFLPLLKKGTLKKVITLSSGLGDPVMVLKAGSDMQPAYCVTKCALEMVNVKYATRYKDEGFIFLAISPGVVNTASAPPPPEVMPQFMKMVGQFKALYPNWKGPIEPSESVQMMMKVVDNLKPTDNGAFLSHFVRGRFPLQLLSSDPLS